MTVAASGPADRSDDALGDRPMDDVQGRTDQPDDRSADQLDDGPAGQLDEPTTAQGTAGPTDQFDERPTGQVEDRPADQERPSQSTPDEAPVRLLQADELQAVVSKWREIQAEFVDEPKRAMQDADELVSELMDRLSRTFAEQREQLESRWNDADGISTEELRQGLQRYRSFFERLLAA